MAGCLGQSVSSEGTPTEQPDGTETPPSDLDVSARGDWDYDGDGESSDLPTRDPDVPLVDDESTFTENAQSGGVARDGIPSIDDPAFVDADEADEALDPGDPVFGVVEGDDARAYTQNVLVWHEIVNDVVGGTPLAITYCPLTGTAMGFERGETTFGVSGRLVNSNLIMYDRATGSWFPQVIGHGIAGELRGRALRQRSVVWTTWERWRSTHPETDVLSEQTGFARDYQRDPYGEYNPTEGYYATGSPMFGVMHTDGRFDDKRVVIGARGPDGALAVEKKRLLESGMLTESVGGVQHVAVADEGLSTGYVYRNPDAISVEPGDGGYRLDGETYAPDELPLDRLVAFDAMWFAWAAFYPHTAVAE